MPSGEDTKTPDQLREAANHEYKYTVTRLQDELEHLVKIFGHMREAFENEMMEGMGYKKLAATSDLMKKAADLAKIGTSVVDAKIRFDKAQKMLADHMTPEDEKKAVVAYLKALPNAERNALLKEFYRWLRERNETYPTYNEPTRGSEGT